MTAHISKPFIHVEDSSGNPYVGAVLYVYDVGTTTLKSIYSDAGLSVAVTNPLSGANASDAAGNFPRVYLASGTYKLRAETSAGVLIWQEDNIDTGLTSGSGALPIASGGTAGTTAAAARTALGAAAQTDVDDLATDIATINTTLQNIVTNPQGYLTPTSGTPVITSDVTAGTSVYYTPFIGNLVPIYDGTQFNVLQFAELTLTLNSNHVANGIYDCFIISDGGTVRIVTGPVWNTVTAGAGARGTGAGTTELVRTNGLYTNAYTMTARNGATTYPVNAHAGTYVGSILIDGSAGQISCKRSFGQSRIWGIWNSYNRKTVTILAGDATASWSYTTATIRASNGSSANSITTLSGLAEEYMSITFAQKIRASTNATTQGLDIGIGFNSTTVMSGRVGSVVLNNGVATNIILDSVPTAFYSPVPHIGSNVFTALELATSAGATANGTQPNMLLQANYQA